jgi:hypothetical protein
LFPFAFHRAVKTNTLTPNKLRDRFLFVYFKLSSYRFY